MAGIRKAALVLAMAPLVANAELAALDDAVLADVSGQSGLVIELGAGSVAGVDAATGDFYGVDWSGAGVTIEAAKWLIDVEDGWDQASNTGVNTNQGNAVAAIGGTINRDIALAGHVDIIIDATADLANVSANGGAVSQGDGGIGISFSNSNLNMKVGDMGIYVEEYDLSNAGGAGTLAAQQINSFGGQEILGINVDGLELVIRGNGL